MKQVSGLRLQVSGLLIAALLLFAAPLMADSKDENLRPLPPSEQAGPAESTTEATSAALEEKYRTELEHRLAEERASYEGSLRSLWLSNAAVWACLLVFIGLQALSARKKAAELARLKADRGSA
jgi:hypothetical protein